jgi:hypothetical protein
VFSSRLNVGVEISGYFQIRRNLIRTCVGNECSFVSSTYGWRWGAFHEVSLSSFFLLLGSQLCIIFQLHTANNFVPCLMY